MKKSLLVLVLSFLSSSLYAFEAVPGEYIAKLKPEHKAAFKTMSMTLRGLNNSRRLTDDLVLIKGDMLNVNALDSDESIYEYIEPNYIYHAYAALPADAKFKDLWGLSNTGKIAGSKAGNDINALKAWDLTKGRKEIVIAVIDTGVEYTHPDLAANIYENAAEKNGKPGVDDDNNGYIDDIRGYDFVNNDNDPMDDVGHGTHCAGTIGAVHNKVGVAGVMAKVKIMPLKFLGQNGGTSAAAIKAIQYATKMKVTLMSNSWGGGAPSKALEEAIKAASDAGITFVAAAGNSSNDNDKTPSYPASYKLPNVISVAALTSAGTMAAFSNFGKTSVHVMAPGDKIMSTYIGKTYKSLSGTSMAAPHISGIVGLMLSEEELSPQEVKERLIASSVPSASLNLKTVSNGRADAFRALTQQ